MRPRVVMLLAIAAIVLGGVLLVPTAYARLTGDAGNTGGGGGGGSAKSTALTPPPPPTLANVPVSVPFKGDFFSWALLDRKTDNITGSKNMAATNSTESMIKIWIVSDYLHRHDKPTSARLHQAELAIWDSNNTAAQSLYVADGGIPVVQRLIDTCDLTQTHALTQTNNPDLKPYIGYWSFTSMSPHDAVRMADCIADGKAAGPKWTKWVLEQMTKVRGTVNEQYEDKEGGRWGIIGGLPKTITDQGLSIKNGWTRLVYDGLWHLNCLAVTDNWALAVMMRYPSGRSLSYGASVCASVATQLVTPTPGATLSVPKPLAKS
jgi:hypothetical protein